MDQIEERILKLEYRMDDHQEELKSLRDISETLKKSLAGIEKTLSQIKWLAIGACAVVLAQQMGLKEALKLIL